MRKYVNDEVWYDLSNNNVQVWGILLAIYIYILYMQMHVPTKTSVCREAASTYDLIGFWISDEFSTWGW